MVPAARCGRCFLHLLSQFSWAASWSCDLRARERRRALRFGLRELVPGGLCGCWGRIFAAPLAAVPRIYKHSPLTHWPVALKYPLAREATPMAPSAYPDHTPAKQQPRLVSPFLSSLAVGATGPRPPTSLRRRRRPLRAARAPPRLPPHLACLRVVRAVAAASPEGSPTRRCLSLSSPVTPASNYGLPHAALTYVVYVLQIFELEW